MSKASRHPNTPSPQPLPPGYFISPLKLFGGGLVLVVLGFSAGVLVQGQMAGGPKPASQPPPAAAPVSLAPVQGGSPDRLGLSQTILQLKDHLEHAPDDLQARVQLGNALFDSENFAEAAVHYRIFLEKNPENPDVRTDLGTALHRTGLNEDAAREFRKALEYAPNHLNANYNLGVVLANELHDQAGAAKAWKRVLDMAPNSPQATQVRASMPQLK
ncbi:MAG: tetratricopeptide repeat protein [Candidatus Latescibacteria bacterium]|nr:tetratricopeptide repeat protein [Candidatus Latescibacterota bacterium]